MDDTQDWYGPDTATFGDRVAAAREISGMNQTELARRLGVRVATLRAWEDDLSEPRANRLSMMAGLLNVSMTWLMNGQGVGIDGPDEQNSIPASSGELLREIRDLRTDLLGKVEQLGRLEKRLRTALTDVTHD